MSSVKSQPLPPNEHAATVTVIREDTVSTFQDVITVARKRADLLNEMRTCFVGGDETGAMRIAKILCGLDEA